VLVVDASVLAVALLDDGQDGDHLRARLHGEDLAAPSLIDLEVVSVWRGLARGGQLESRRVAFALDDLRALPLQRVDHAALVLRCWELREDLTVYDASYVALAEALRATLLTGDQRLARAPGPTCLIEVIKPPSRAR
jgi:predicted nucleic acid-binding protein